MSTPATPAPAPASDSPPKPFAQFAPFAPPGLILLVAVAGMSWGGPLVRLATAPALAVAAWRLIFSTLIILLVLVVRRELGLLRLARGEWGLALAAGVMLAGHFWSWIGSLAYTSVASSVVLVNTQPIFVGLLSAVFLRERPRRLQWLGILVAVGGAAVIGWGDFGRGPAPLLGDLMSVAGAVFVACYYVIGRRLRPRMQLWTYTGVVYGIAALVLTIAVLLSPGISLARYPAGDWLVFLALAAVPMMIGHTGVNYALRFVPAHVANVALLGEPIGATLIAWLLPAIHETPPPQTLVGGALILIGITLGMWRWRLSPPARQAAQAAMDLREESL